VVGVPSEFTADFNYYHMWEKSADLSLGPVQRAEIHENRFLDLIASGRLKPEMIISHRMKLDQAAEAYKMFDAREATKNRPYSLDTIPRVFGASRSHQSFGFPHVLAPTVRF